MNQSGQVTEVYPFASKVRLFSKTIPGKTTNQGMLFLKEKFGGILPSLRSQLDSFNHDLYDAAMAAHTALLYHQNRTDTLGTIEEGVIIIPIDAQ